MRSSVRLGPAGPAGSAGAATVRIAQVHKDRDSLKNKVLKCKVSFKQVGIFV